VEKVQGSRFTVRDVDAYQKCIRMVYGMERTLERQSPESDRR